MYRWKLLCAASFLAGAAPALAQTVSPYPGATGMMDDYCLVKPLAGEPQRDWPYLCRYQAANAAVINAPELVLIGDSITDSWIVVDPDMFSAAWLDRGISGQTTSQMLARFYADVIALKPRSVHILAGTNDIAGNTGLTSAAVFRNNITAMVDLAEKNGIKVMLASILPADHFAWRPGIQPKDQIIALNAWLKNFAQERRVTYVDYYSEMATPEGAMRPSLTADGAHPNLLGYAVMRRVLKKALAGI
jgi:lysophospholipase L1-like esterase